MFKIEKNVPMPARRNRTDVFPFDQMETNDSFFVPFEGGDKTIIKNYVNRAVVVANKRNSHPPLNGATRINKRGIVVPARIYSKKWSTKEVDGGVRVWRTV